MAVTPVLNPLGEVTVPERPAVPHPHVATTFLRMRREPKPANERVNPANEHEWFRELALTVRGGYNSATQMFIPPEDLALLSEADRAKCRPLSRIYPDVDALGEQWPVVGLVMLLVNNAAPRLLLLDEVLLPQLAALDSQIAAAAGAKAGAEARAAELPDLIAICEDVEEVAVLAAELASLPGIIAGHDTTLAALGVQRDGVQAAIAPVQAALTDVPAALGEAMGG